MPGIVVVGSQWGDEGKGKVVDLFSIKSDLVVRYQGGANAGHTLVVNGKKTILHLIPSGVLNPSTKCLIASGVVLDIEVVVKEIDALQKNNLLKDNDQLLISDGVTLLMPYHRLLDTLREKSAGREKIGTTGKGIGPAYEDRASRKAILLRDIYDLKTLRKKLNNSLKEKNFLIEKYYNSSPFAIDELMELLEKSSKILKPFRCKDASGFVYKMLMEKKKVLFEGAQGTLLDLHHGTYPYVTSSSTIAGFACAGIGIGPQHINKVLGITKSYATRVGSGPFPSELDNEYGDHIRKQGNEFGATTGRPRRCGWLDLIALKYAIRINGITNLALTNLDVLSGFKKIATVIGYKMNNKIIDIYPTSTEELSHCRPILKEFEGWEEDMTQCKTKEDLPDNAKKYIKDISKALEVPIDVISVGPGREQTIWIKALFEE